MFAHVLCLPSVSDGLLELWILPDPGLLCLLVCVFDRGFVGLKTLFRDLFYIVLPQFLPLHLGPHTPGTTMLLMWKVRQDFLLIHKNLNWNKTPSTSHLLNWSNSNSASLSYCLILEFLRCIWIFSDQRHRESVAMCIKTFYGTWI